MADELRDLTFEVRKLLGVFRELVLKRYADMGEIVASLPGRLELVEGASREGFEELSESIERLAGRVERLEQIALLEKTSGDASRHKGEIRREHDTEHLKRLLAQTIKNLNRARERAARYGGDIPTALVNEIDEYEAAIERIEADLKS